MQEVADPDLLARAQRLGARSDGGLTFQALASSHNAKSTGMPTMAKKIQSKPMGWSCTAVILQLEQQWFAGLAYGVQRRNSAEA